MTLNTRLVNVVELWLSLILCGIVAGFDLKIKDWSETVDDVSKRHILVRLCMAHSALVGGLYSTTWLLPRQSSIRKTFLSARTFTG